MAVGEFTEDLGSRSRSNIGTFRREERVYHVEVDPDAADFEDPKDAADFLPYVWGDPLPGQVDYFDQYMQLRDFSFAWQAGTKKRVVARLVWTNEPSVRSSDSSWAVVWKHSIGYETEQVSHAIEGAVIPGGTSRIVPVTTITATMERASLTQDMINKVGTVNENIFRGYAPADVLFLAADAEPIQWVDPLDPFTANVVLTFQAKRPPFGADTEFGNYGGQDHWSPVPDPNVPGRVLQNQYIPYALYRKSDFKTLFPANFNPGPHVT